RKWDCEPVSMSTTSSDESKLKFDMKVDRLGRAEWGISATLEWKYDSNEETWVEASAYHSSSGAESEYKLLPWAIPKQSFYDYLNTNYKDVLMKNVGHCSNFPQFEGTFQPPWPQSTYKLDKCKITGDGLPDIAPPGFYKIIFSTYGNGQPTWGFTGVFKLTNKLF
ncbi:hypothetical protein KR084_006649, partial [Drosophila pseudotakahashii]